MRLSEFEKLRPKMEASPRGRIDLIKRTSDADDSFTVFFKLESGSHAQIAKPDDWPIPRDVK